jgi:hypothetical protein
LREVLDILIDSKTVIRLLPSTQNMILFVDRISSRAHNCSWLHDLCHLLNLHAWSLRLSHFIFDALRFITLPRKRSVLVHLFIIQVSFLGLTRFVGSILPFHGTRWLLVDGCIFKIYLIYFSSMEPYLILFKKDKRPKIYWHSTFEYSFHSIHPLSSSCAWDDVIWKSLV